MGHITASGGWISNAGKFYPNGTPDHGADEAERMADVRAWYDAGEPQSTDDEDRQWFAAHGFPYDQQQNSDDYGQVDVGHLFGLTPSELDPNAPGTSLDTGNADAERGRTEQLLGQLQQQAATGDGAWEKTLADATQRAQATASAIGQSQANNGGNYQTSLMNIANAQTGAAQRGVGQGNILRAQSQQDAQGQLGDLLGRTGEQDIGQAADVAGVNQGVRELNNQLRANFRQSSGNTAAGAGQAAATIAAASDGGRVPGQPVVFGDDSRNDTQPAMLSPGEIVVPRSAADDPEAAAAFARAVAERGSAQGLASGGSTSGSYGIHDANAWDAIRNAGALQAPSIGNGGLLDSSQFDASRGATLGLADQLGGPLSSAAPQMLNNAEDETVAGTLQNVQAMNDANALASATAAQQGAGGQAAAAAGNEQSRTQKLLAATLTGQRQRDMAMARAQQQAGFRNTQINAGVSLADQATLQKLTGATGQAAVTLAGMDKGDGGGSERDPYSLGGGDTVGDASSAQTHDDPGSGIDESLGGGDEEGDRAGLAFGGEVPGDDEHARARRFLQLLRSAA
jgi:hypothetical protein